MRQSVKELNIGTYENLVTVCINEKFYIETYKILFRYL